MLIKNSYYTLLFIMIKYCVPKYLYEIHVVNSLILCRVKFVIIWKKNIHAKWFYSRKMKSFFYLEKRNLEKFRNEKYLLTNIELKLPKNNIVWKVETFKPLFFFFFKSHENQQNRFFF